MGQPIEIDQTTFNYIMVGAGNAGCILPHRLVHSGGTEAEKTINANKEIILSAGAIRSPKLLQLSGAACPELHQKIFQGLTQINSLKTYFVE